MRVCKARKRHETSLQEMFQRDYCNPKFPPSMRASELKAKSTPQIQSAGKGRPLVSEASEENASLYYRL